MRRILYTGLLLAGIWSASNAQSDVDALRYSQSQPGATARSLGVVGAFGALGADLSSAAINPAGIGIYRNNQVIFSGAMLNTSANSTYLNSGFKDNEFNLNIPSLGLVFTNQHFNGRKPATEGWIFTNVSLGMTRSNSFTGVINYAGSNSSTSMLDYFASRANGLSKSQLGGKDSEFDNGFDDIETMAWEAYLIDSVGDRMYAAAIDPNARTIHQKQVISTSGAMNEYHITLAANYSNKLFLGGGLNITSVRYNETDRFRETDDIDNGAIWDTWILQRELRTRGVGVSGRLGMIIKPVKWLRTGLALQTPTIFNLDDTYWDELASDLDDGNGYRFESKEGTFDYKVVTPMKTTLSAAAILAKKGFVSADVEMADYSTMRLRPTIDAFEVANDVIRTKYGKAVNIRVGGEYVYDMYRFRLGYAHYGSPLENAEGANLKDNFITGGVGIRDKNWALDLALVHQRGERVVQPYVLNGISVDAATAQLRNNRLVVTLSSNF
ncbi:MAG: hypothetical protein H6606_02485 [Flavobacteriales bacterium]|nr:hypothetical protein [Flavobacteriales bacterium]